jgi:hypothetical protein
VKKRHGKPGRTTAPKAHPDASPPSTADKAEHHMAQEGNSDALAQANLGLTRWLVRWTAALAIVGIATVVVGGITAGVAYVQWKALVKTDNTTREAFTAVQRPFIIATDLDAVQGQPPYWTFRTILENTGSTPTKNLTVTSSVSFSVPILPDSPTDPAELSPQTTEPYPTVSDYFLGPHGKATVDAITLISKTLEDMADQRADFFVYGIARYNDEFAETQERSTKFCFVARPFKGPNGLSLHNRSLCHHWNCGDEDCERDKRKYEVERAEVLRKNPNAREMNKPIPLAAIIPFYPTPIIKAQ